MRNSRGPGEGQAIAPLCTEHVPDLLRNKSEYPAAGAQDVSSFIADPGAEGGSVGGTPQTSQPPAHLQAGLAWAGLPTAPNGQEPAPAAQHRAPLSARGSS